VSLGVVTRETHQSKASSKRKLLRKQTNSGRWVLLGGGREANQMVGRDMLFLEGDKTLDRGRVKGGGGVSSSGLKR